MIIQNNIGWCDDTTNAVTGCDKVSPGCKNCYAQIGTRARVLRSQGIETWGPKGVRHPVAEFAKKIRRLNKLCVCDSCHMAYSFLQQGGLGYCDGLGGCGGKLRRIRLFADSNSDWLDPKWEPETLANFLLEIHNAPNVNIQLLTKRPELWRERLCAAGPYLTNGFPVDWMHEGKAPANIWLGVSVENQEMADKRIPELLKIPAAIRFLSCEPLLDMVNLNCVNFGDKIAVSAQDVLLHRACEPHTHKTSGIDWVIVGAESGPKRREVDVGAILNVADQCHAAGIPCFVKQDGAITGGQQGRIGNIYWSRKEMPHV